MIDIKHEDHTITTEEDEHSRSPTAVSTTNLF
jgi:hypothetical protein